MSYSPPMYRNVFAQTSQNNFHRQQINPPQIQFPPDSFVMNHQGIYPQSPFGRPSQPDPFLTSYHQAPSIPPTTGHFVPIPQTHYDPTPIGQSTHLCFNGYLPQHILDQIRTSVGNTTPIFILPNNSPNPSPAAPQQQQQQQPIAGMGYPGLGMGYPVPPSVYCPPSCYPLPLPMSFYDLIANQNHVKNAGCDCCKKMNVRSSGSHRNFGTSYYNSEEHEEHRCTPGNDDAICTKKNCPSVINLQALTSQLLSIQGIISCVITRLILRKIPGSNINTTMEETLERGRKSIDMLNKDQLLAEAKSAQQVNALINLHMTAANPPANIIPTLTLLQLKVNLLKARVESLMNKKLMESQSFAMSDSNNNNLDLAILSLKSDVELRELMSIFRQKECEERVNFNFAPYHAQRIIAEGRLNNIQNKISQLEGEMDRRRSAELPQTAIVHVAQPYSDSYRTLSGLESAGLPLQNYKSPNPFLVQVRSPRRLNLMPFAGSPNTTYERPRNVLLNERASKDEKVCYCFKDSQGACGNSDKCTCSNASCRYLDTDNKGNKKLLLKIVENGNVNFAEDRVHQKISEKDQLEFSPNVVSVIDKTSSCKNEIKTDSEEWKVRKGASSESTRPLRGSTSNNSLLRNVRKYSDKEKDVEKSNWTIEKDNQEDSTENGFMLRAKEDVSNSIEFMLEVEENASTSSKCGNFEMDPSVEHDGSLEDISKTSRPYDQDKKSCDSEPIQSSIDRTNSHKMTARKDECKTVDVIEDELFKTQFPSASRDSEESYYSTISGSVIEEKERTEISSPRKEDNLSSSSKNSRDLPTMNSLKTGRR